MSSSSSSAEDDDDDIVVVQFGSRRLREVTRTARTNRTARHGRSSKRRRIKDAVPALHVTVSARMFFVTSVLQVESILRRSDICLMNASNARRRTLVLVLRTSDKNATRDVTAPKGTSEQSGKQNQGCPHFQKQHCNKDVVKTRMQC